MVMPWEQPKPFTKEERVALLYNLRHRVEGLEPLPMIAERYEATVAALEAKYEAAGLKCHAGHVNHLPLALWDCPMCVGELRENLATAHREIAAWVARAGGA